MDLLSLQAAVAVAAATSRPPLAQFPSFLLVASKLAIPFSRATNKLSASFAVNARTAISARALDPTPASIASRTRWMVVTERPPGGGSSRAEVIDYYVETLASILESEKEAQMCIYDASWQNQYGFCCEIDEKSSRELARMPGVLSVRPDTDEGHRKKDYSYSDLLQADQVETGSPNVKLSSVVGNNQYWVVRMQKPGVEVVTKAQMLGYYVRTLTKVLGNEKDAQACIYHIPREHFGFCCEIDEACAWELVDVPEVFSVRPDMNFESENKDYTGNGSDPSVTNHEPKVGTKRLFVTGLSFYTSEKTLRAAFEGFGELVEVKIIIDKISKRSKGFAFIEYTTEEAASAALKEMNGKIINGWMIVVDVAKRNPPKYSRGHPRPSSLSGSSS